MKNDTPAILSAAVDRLATIKAQVAALNEEADNLKAALSASGLAVIEGTLHRAAVSHCPGRELIDWKTIAARFNPSRQLVAAHTSVGEPYDVIRLSARKGS